MADKSTEELLALVARLETLGRQNGVRYANARWELAKRNVLPLPPEEIPLP